jgi:hypothetical protein
VRKTLNIFSSLPLMFIWLLLASLVVVIRFDPGRGLAVALAAVGIYLSIVGAEQLHLI